MKTEIDELTCKRINEILVLLLNHYEQRKPNCPMCIVLGDYFDKHFISRRHYIAAADYINSNRPSAFSSFAAFKHRNSVTYWPTKDYKNRINWLKKHIKLTEI